MFHAESMSLLVCQRADEEPWVASFIRHNQAVRRQVSNGRHAVKAVESRRAIFQVVNAAKNRNINQSKFIVQVITQ